MINTIFFRALFITFQFCLIYSASLSAQFAGGNGSLANPYQVATLQQLQEISNHLDKHFILLQDIDASETTSWNSGQGFIPIGDEANAFSGHLNGQGFTISGLQINRPNKAYNGLFGHINEGSISDLHLTEISVQGENITGGLTGKVTSGEIQNSSVEGKIKGRTHVGGLVGFNRGRIENNEAKVEATGTSYIGGLVGINRGRIIQSKSSSKVNGTGHNAGGLVGNNYDGLISESIAEGTVTGEKASSIGGLSGSNGGLITRSYSTADVSGKSYVGGLVGNNHSGEIKWSYSTGTVSGFNLVGGLAGVNRRNGKIEETYTVSKVTGTLETGGFIGVNRDPVKAGYWDKEKSGQSIAVSTGNAEGITALNSDEITGNLSYENMSGFSFNSIWGYVPDKTPQLLWTTSYFVIREVFSPTSTITSGDFIYFEVSLKNSGKKKDTNDLILWDGKDTELDRIDNITLSPNEDTTAVLSWQTTTDDKGNFELEFRTQQFSRVFPLTVLRMPDQVELEKPFELQEDIETSPAFTWNPAFLADSYQLQISENENFDPILINVSDIDTTTFELNYTLKHDTYYHWRVRGVNADEKGPWSESWPFISIIERPEKVALKAPLDETEDALTRPTFFWSETKRAENYKLEISSDDEFEKVVFDTTITALDSSLTLERDLPSKQQFFWRMQATNVGGASDWSDIRSFIPISEPTKRASSTGLNYTLEQNYPNPFNPTTYIRYSIPEATRVQIDVLNMLGQTVATLEDGYKSAGWHTVTFNASKLSSGFYIYRMKTENYSYSRKLSLVK